MHRHIQPAVPNTALLPILINQATYNPPSSNSVATKAEEMLAEA
jgi:hypothetical protein